MRKALNLFMCMTVVLIFAAATLAQTNPPGSPTQGKKQGVVNRERVMGTVVSVDAVGKTIVVKCKNAILTFEINDATKVKLNGMNSTLENLRSNQRVTVVYKQHAKKKVALVVMVLQGPDSPDKEQTRPGRE